jgi:hypothetical protein
MDDRRQWRHRALGSNRRKAPYVSGSRARSSLSWPAAVALHETSSRCGRRFPPVPGERAAAGDRSPAGPPSACPSRRAALGPPAGALGHRERDVRVPGLRRRARPHGLRYADGWHLIPHTISCCVEDPVEIRRRTQAILKRVSRRDDYGQLLVAGHVVADLSRLEDPAKWRADLRRRARADRIKLRTGINISGTHAYAVLLEGWTGAREDESDRYMSAMREAIPRASALGHEPDLVLRDGDESICKCGRCPALGLVDASMDQLIGGPLFEDECPHEDPPATTGMTMFFGSG